MLNSKVRDLGLINHIKNYCEDISHTHANQECCVPTVGTNVMERQMF